MSGLSAEITKSSGLKSACPKNCTVEGNSHLSEEMVRKVAETKKRTGKIPQPSSQLMIGHFTAQLLQFLGAYGEEKMAARQVVQNATMIHAINELEGKTGTGQYCADQSWTVEKEGLQTKIAITHFLVENTLMSRVKISPDIAVNDHQIILGAKSIPEAVRQYYTGRIRDGEGKRLLPSEIFELFGYTMDEDVEDGIETYLWGGSQELILKMTPKKMGSMALDKKLINLFAERLNITSIMTK